MPKRKKFLIEWPPGFMTIRFDWWLNGLRNVNALHVPDCVSNSIGSRRVVAATVNATGARIAAAAAFVTMLVSSVVPTRDDEHHQRGAGAGQGQDRIGDVIAESTVDDDDTQTPLGRR